MNAKPFDMETTTNTRPRIFISYSWSPVTHKNWVLDLADRLTRDGIHVIIDEWDAIEGQDKYHFMEKMVNDTEVKNVLLICNKEYSEKANLKKGGVGIESQIISSEIYYNVDQKKFIPIVRERSDEGNAYLPTFVSSRFYIDLSDSDTYEANYEQLIRRIFDKPKSKRPPMGAAPSYITEEGDTFLKTAHKFRPLKDALINDKSSWNGLLKEYFDLFNETLTDFQIQEIPNDYVNRVDEFLLGKIEQLRSLRDEYIQGIQKCKMIYCLLF